MDLTRFLLISIILLLLLRKGFCPYEFVDDWEKFSETSLLKKVEFYSNLENITDSGKCLSASALAWQEAPKK